MSYWNEWTNPECNLADNGEHVKENGGCILCGALTLESQGDLASVAVAIKATKVNMKDRKTSRLPPQPEDYDLDDILREVTASLMNTETVIAIAMIARQAATAPGACVAIETDDGRFVIRFFNLEVMDFSGSGRYVIDAEDVHEAFAEQCKSFWFGMQEGTRPDMEKWNA